MFQWIESSSQEWKVDPIAIFARYPDFSSTQFEFPVGGKFGEGFYLSQRFGVENSRFGNRFHLGEDWSHISGGDSDFGAPVFSISQGVVRSTGDYGGGWGKVIRIVHRLKNESQITYFESLYAHLYSIEVEPGALVNPGDWIGTIGNAGGSYISHLHLELRNSLELPLGGGYDYQKTQFIAPTKFLAKQLAKEKWITEDTFQLNVSN